MIAGKKRLLRRQGEAEMVRQMARRVHRFDAPAGAVDDRAVADDFIGREFSVAAFVERRGVMLFLARGMGSETENRRARAFGEAPRAAAFPSSG